MGDEFVDEADLQLGGFDHYLLYVEEDIYADYYFTAQAKFSWLLF